MEITRRLLGAACRIVLHCLLLTVTLSVDRAEAAVRAETLLLRPVADADPLLLRRFKAIDPRESLARAVRFAPAAAKPLPLPGAMLEGTGCLALMRVPPNDATRIWRALVRCHIKSRPIGPKRPVAPVMPKLEEVAEAPKPEEKAEEDDPFEPKGIKVGAFVIKPALELTVGVDSNPLRMPRGGRPAQTRSVVHELEIRSQFERHELNADLSVGYSQTQGVPVLNAPAVDAKIDGRYDITDDRSINGEVRYALDPVDRVLEAPRGTFVSKSGATVGVSQKLDNVSVSVKGLVDRSTFSGARPGDDAPIPNKDRNFTQPAVQTRVSYALSPQISPFVDVTLDRRVHDIPVDFGGVRRDSNGTVVSAGLSLAFAGRLAGEIAVGYLTRRFADPMLPGISGMIVNGALVYRPFDRTSFVLVGTSDTLESVIPGVSGIFRRDLILQARQEFDPRTSASLSFGFGQDRFAGIVRTDDRYSVALGAVYKLSREVQLKADVRQDWLRSTIPTVNNMATTATVGIRFQY